MYTSTEILGDWFCLVGTNIKPNDYGEWNLCWSKNWNCNFQIIWSRTLVRMEHVKYNLETLIAFIGTWSRGASVWGQLCRSGYTDTKLSNLRTGFVSETSAGGVWVRLLLVTVTAAVFRHARSSYFHRTIKTLWAEGNAESDIAIFTLPLPWKDSKVTKKTNNKIYLLNLWHKIEF